MAQVKGVAILGLIKFIKGTMKDTLPRIIKALPPETKKYLDQHIMFAQWYPYSVYTDLIKTVDRVDGKGDLSSCIELGRLAAKNDLASVYKVFANYSDPKMLLTSSMNMWTSYYDSGKLDVDISSVDVVKDAEMVLTIKDFPDIDIAHVKNVQGWMEEFLNMYKLKNITSHITKCQCHGDPMTEIRFTYDRV